MQKTFFSFGLGPTAQDPLYGLLDIEKNFFYVVHFRKDWILQTQKILSLYRKTEVVAIHKCSHWHYNQIDNTVCWNWGVDRDLKKIMDQEDFEISLVELSAMVHDSETMTVINHLQYILYYMDLFDRRYPYFERLQESYNFHPVAIIFDSDPWIQQARKIETQQIQDLQDQWKLFWQDFYVILHAHGTALHNHDYIDLVRKDTKQLAFQSNFHFNLLEELYD